MLLSASNVLDCTYTAIPVNEAVVQKIGVRAVEDGALKKGGKYGFPAILTFSSDDDILYSSSSGEVYIYSDKESVRAGDELICYGSFSEPSFFVAQRIIVTYEKPFRSLRGKMESLLRERLSPLSEGSGQLAMMLLLAIVDDGESPLSELAREKGVSHVFALSGMHLSIISSLLLPFIAFFAGRKRAERIVLFPLFFFTFLSGFRASLLRALIFRLLNTVFRGNDEDSFALTFIIHSALFPESLMRAGAVFSYLSIAGLFLLSHRFEDFFEEITGFRLSFIASSISCLIFTIPYSFHLFSSYSLSGIIYSPVINALTTLYMGLLFLFLAFPVLSFPLDACYLAIEKILSMTAFSSSFENLEPYYVLISISSLLLISCFLKRNLLAYILKPCGILITKRQKKS